MTKIYTDQELLNTIEKMVTKSDFLPNHMIDHAKKLNRENLEKFIIMVYSAYKTEFSMSKKEKHDFKNMISSFFKEQTRIYRQAQQKWTRYLESKLQKIETSQQEAILAQINKKKSKNHLHLNFKLKTT